MFALDQGRFTVAAGASLAMKLSMTTGGSVIDPEDEMYPPIKKKKKVKNQSESDEEER